MSARGAKEHVMSAARTRGPGGDATGVASGAVSAIPRNAIVGAVAWGLLIADGLGGLYPMGLLEALLAFAPLVVMPLALDLRARVARDLTISDALEAARRAARFPVLAEGRSREVRPGDLGGAPQRSAPPQDRPTGYDRLAFLDRAARTLVLPGALFTAASFVLPPGRTAAYLASPWIVVCVLIALGTWVRAAAPLMARRGSFVEWALLAASAAYLPVGAIWVVLSRLGVPVAGFLLPIPTLTAIHFHYTMFALPTIAAATGVALRSRTWLRLLFAGVAVVIISGPALLLTGWMLRFVPLKLLATLLIAAGTAGLSAIVLVLSPHVLPAAARGLLRCASGAVVAAMALAVLYGAGEYFEREWISIPRMAQLHGALNAFGFTLCGLLGWLLVNRNGASDEHRREHRS